MSKYDNNWTGSLTQSRKESKQFYYNGVYCKNGSNSMKRTADKACMCYTCSEQR